MVPAQKEAVRTPDMSVVYIITNYGFVLVFLVSTKHLLEFKFHMPSSLVSHRSFEGTIHPSQNHATFYILLFQNHPT